MLGGKIMIGKKFVTTNASSTIGKVIAVISGKGGVGKSMVTSMAATTMAKKGHSVGIIDADITGPSIPKGFGITDKARSTAEGIPTGKSKKGIQVMSTSMMLERDNEPVMWRGAVIGNMVKQFWTDVIWGKVDYMFIDMPSGTGDVALTVFKSLPVDGVVIVTSPQDLVNVIVSKAVTMASQMNLPILGIVENMSFFHCPDNNKDYDIFGKSHVDEIAKKYNIKVLAKLPIKPEISGLIDAGKIEDYDTTLFEPLVEAAIKVPMKPRG
jgi:Mrp family chromosome partitioning ATPase